MLENAETSNLIWKPLVKSLIERFLVPTLDRQDIGLSVFNGFQNWYDVARWILPNSRILGSWVSRIQNGFGRLIRGRVVVSKLDEESNIFIVIEELRLFNLMKRRDDAETQEAVEEVEIETLRKEIGEKELISEVIEQILKPSSSRRHSRKENESEDAEFESYFSTLDGPAKKAFKIPKLPRLPKDAVMNERRSYFLPRDAKNPEAGMLCELFEVGKIWK
jgi:hypothetical protein